MSICIPITLPRELLEEFDKWWKSNGFTSRSEAIRSLMRLVLKQLPPKGE